MEQHDLIRISLSLALVVMLLFVGAWLVKRKGLGKTKSGPAIEILSSRSLGGRNHIVVVQIDEAQLVVGVTPQHISLLHTFAATTHPEATATTSAACTAPTIATQAVDVETSSKFEASVPFQQALATAQQASAQQGMASTVGTASSMAATDKAAASTTAQT